MNKQGPILIQQLIQTSIEQSPHRQKMMEASIANAWYQVMPSLVSKKTKLLYVKQSKIFVEIISSSLRHELHNSKQAILERLQDHVSGYAIDDIVFIS